MTVKEFIDQVLIQQIGQIVEINPYLASPLIAIGIEFLGNLEDEEDFNHYSVINNQPSSETRFKAGIKLFENLDKKYKNGTFIYSQVKSDRLYGDFRNGLAHTLIPKKGVVLSSEDNEELHLKCNASNKVFNIDIKVLFKHFVEVCNMRIADIDKDINKEKPKWHEQILEVNLPIKILNGNLYTTMPTSGSTTNISSTYSLPTLPNK